ncbi:glutamate synthase subunit alpha, partial [Enterococcus sp. S181_ASV_20]|nr:glutamate synthase subunit alpha [Enterococcus sp. S181_ASV_20]
QLRRQRQMCIRDRCFTDGEMVGATLDRNGLRPSRYSITKDGFVQVASESGVVDFEPSNVIEKGVLGPANMILVDTINGKFYRNQEIKEKYAKAHTYKDWLAENRIELSQLAEAEEDAAMLNAQELQKMWKLNGYTDEIIRDELLPMAEKGEEPVLSMGYDSPLAVLSDKPQSLFTYFKQQFAQVTNPPIDAIREQLVIGTEMFLGRDGDIRIDDAHNCQKLKIKSPVLSSADFGKIVQLNTKEQKAVTISTLYSVGRQNALEDGLEQMFKEAESAIDNGGTILILSDRGAEKTKMAMPILLAVSGCLLY